MVDTARPNPERHQPPNGSEGYPGWVCKNACTKPNGERRIWPEDTNDKKCKECGAPLVRWLKYEEKS